MGSRPYINISLLIIIASMGMLASSNTIQPEMAYDFPTCLEAIKGCFYQIHQFKLALLSGAQPSTGLIGPACCAAIMDIHEKCWLFVLPDPFFTPELQNYCTSQTAPPPGPLSPDTPLAPVAPLDPETPAPAPQVDPPAPAPQAPSTAPQVDPPAPAPQAPSPAQSPQVDPSPAPAPHRRHCHRHRHHGGSLDEKWFCT